MRFYVCQASAWAGGSARRKCRLAEPPAHGGSRPVELLARDDYEALGELHGSQGWRADSWDSAMRGYWDEYAGLGIGADARSSALVLIDRLPEEWHVRQVFDDPAGDHDWGLSVEVDLAVLRGDREPELTLFS